MGSKVSTAHLARRTGSCKLARGAVPVCLSVPAWNTAQARLEAFSGAACCGNKRSHPHAQLARGCCPGADRGPAAVTGRHAACQGRRGVALGGDGGPARGVHTREGLGCTYARTPRADAAARIEMCVPGPGLYNGCLAPLVRKCTVARSRSSHAARQDCDRAVVSAWSEGSCVMNKWVARAAALRLDQQIKELGELMIRRRLFIKADRMFKKPKPGKKRLVKWPKKLVPLYDDKVRARLLPACLPACLPGCIGKGQAARQAVVSTVRAAVSGRACRCADMSRRSAVRPGRPCTGQTRSERAGICGGALLRMAVRAAGVAVAVCAERAAGGRRDGLLPVPARAALVRRAVQPLRTRPAPAAAIPWGSCRAAACVSDVSTVVPTVRMYVQDRDLPSEAT